MLVRDSWEKRMICFMTHLVLREELALSFCFLLFGLVILLFFLYSFKILNLVWIVVNQ